MRLLQLISWQYFRRHKLRWLLTIAGIVIGVSVFVGMHTANRSVLAAFQQTINRIAGTTQLQVSAGESGFPEEVLETVQGLPEVRAAVPVIEASVRPDLPGAGNLLLLGVDMTGDRGVRDYELEGEDGEGDVAIEDPLVFLAQPDSLIITRSLADQTRVPMNGKIPMATMAGPKVFTVRGIMKPGGLASAFGGNLAVMDIYAAQKILGRGRRFDRIDIVLREGQAVAPVRDKLRALLGEGFLVDAPSARGQQFEATSQIYSVVTNITSLFALFIGMFIIYSTFEIAVTQRRAEIGILRSLGATERQIGMLFLVESVVAGLIGSLCGIAAGLLMARGISQYVVQLLSEVYGVAQRADDITLNPWVLGAAAIMGLATSVVAAWVPSRHAAAIDPVKALQKGQYQVIGAGETRWRQILATVFGAAALVCFRFVHIRPMFYAGYLLAILTAVLIVPSAVAILARFLAPVLKAVRPVEGAMAADSLILAPRRTSGAVTALMLSLALVVGLAGMAGAIYLSINRWLEVALNPDLFVTTSESLTQRSFVFPPEIGDGLRSIPGVDTVQSVRSVRLNVRNTPVMLITAEIEALEKRSKLDPVAGDASTMYKITAAGKGALVSDNFSRLRGFQLNDTLEIATPSGLLRLPIVGITVDYSDQQGSILIARNLFIEYWKDPSVNVFRLYLKPGAEEAAVRQKIQEMYGNRTRLFVFTNHDLRGYILRLTDQWFGLTYVQIAVAVLVAILGIVNALTVSITDRKRELGVLQAVGGLRAQIRGSVWMEALAIGLMGLILGVIVGAIQLYYMLEIADTDLAGLRLEYRFPWLTIAAMFPLILGVAWFAAIGPGESAVRTPLVEALEYE